jgi:hypothetical protein
MASINLPGITVWGNVYSQRMCPSPVFLRLVQRDVLAQSRFLVRSRLLTRSVPLPTERDTFLRVDRTMRGKFAVSQATRLHTGPLRGCFGWLALECPA